MHGDRSLPSATNPIEELGVPSRPEGALLWLNERVDPGLLQRRGWDVRSFRELYDEFIIPARAQGSARTTLANPAEPLLDLLDRTSAIAVVGVSIKSAADLRDLYGFVVEPAYRRGITLLISADRDLADLDPTEFIDPVGYAWTLERLRYVADRYRLGPAPDDLPPLTPIEWQLWVAMRERGLAPIAQYGIGPYRADFAFTEVRLVVECDGRQWHEPEHDRRRDAALRRRGWDPLHFTGSEIHHDAAGCVARIERAIAERRSTVATEQPLIEIPGRRSWWQRFLERLRSIFGGRSDQVRDEAADRADEAESDIPSRLPSWAADLDDEQRAAVMARDGVVQVIAPAGSGKTAVLVARVRELLARGVPPNRILCCTFNKAAAVELQQRLEQAGVDGVKAATFHSIGRSILDDTGALRGDPTTLTQGQWKRLAKLAKDATDNGIWIDAPEAAERISDLKLDRMVTVDEFAAIASGADEETLAELYRRYEDQLAEQRQTDFDDYIFQSVRLLQRDPQVRGKWQRTFSAVLVDEFQDIEPAQQLLIQILASPEDLLFCVGDEDQCLYAWRRASVERVIELDQSYPGLERRALVRNYRSPVKVVDSSSALISRNVRRFPKQIEPARSEPGDIVLVSATDLEAQGAHAARLVRECQRGEAVVLARTISVLSEIAVGLAQAGVRFSGPARIKGRTGEQGVLHAYVRLLSAPERARQEDVASVFRRPSRYLPDGMELNIASGLRKGLSFTEVVERLRVDSWRKEKGLRPGAVLFDELVRIKKADELIHRLRTDGGLDNYYGEAEALDQSSTGAVEALARAEETAAGMSVGEYADALDERAHIVEQHFDPKGVELSTIHGAKGREWPLVIVAGAQEGELPHTRSLLDTEDPDGELEGERRLAYVAFTRSSERLVLLYSREQSRFIGEGAVSTYASTVAAADVKPDVEPNRVDAPAEEISGGPTVTVFRPQQQGPSITGLDDQTDALPAAHARAAVIARRDGSVPCSMPGCDGSVGPDFVLWSDEGPRGLCARFELHEALAMSDDAAKRVWVELKPLSDRAGRSRRRAMGLVDSDSIICSLPGCEGFVGAEFILSSNGSRAGLCPQRLLHESLAELDSKTQVALSRLLQARGEPWVARANASAGQRSGGSRPRVPATTSSTTGPAANELDDLPF